MNFVNNWQTKLTANIGTGTGMALPAPAGMLSRLSGTTLLTLSDGEAIEIIEYDTDANQITARGLENTAPRSWPEDSDIYQSITAGQVNGLFSALGQLSSISQQLQNLSQRVDALEQGGGNGGSYVGTDDIEIQAGIYNDEEWEAYGAEDGAEFEFGGIGQIYVLRWVRYMDDGRAAYFIHLQIDPMVANTLSTASIKIGNQAALTAQFEGMQGGNTHEFFGDITQQQFDSLPKSGTHTVTITLTE